MLGLTAKGLYQTPTLRDCRHGHGSEFSSDAGIVEPRWRREDDAESDREMESLVRTIESEIIPRLMLAHRSVAEFLPHLLPGDVVIGSSDVADFAKLVLTADIASVVSVVDSLRARGVQAEVLCLDLLAPTARRLGELWEADLCDFIEVTVGLGRLQQVLRELTPALREDCETPLAGHRILLAPAPGDQHSLGLLIVREFFRCAGWEVRGDSASAEPEIHELLKTEWFDAAGLSVGAEYQLNGLARFIRSIRASSLNRNIGILVGGPIFIEHPEYAGLVGADATAADAPQAVLQAETLVALRR